MKKIFFVIVILISIASPGFPLTVNAASSFDDWNEGVVPNDASSYVDFVREGNSAVISLSESSQSIWARLGYDTTYPKSIGLMATFNISKMDGCANTGIRMWKIGYHDGIELDARIEVNSCGSEKTIYARIRENVEGGKEIVHLEFEPWKTKQLMNKNITAALARMGNEIWFYVEGYENILKYTPTFDMGNFSPSPELFIWTSGAPVTTTFSNVQVIGGLQDKTSYYSLKDLYNSNNEIAAITLEDTENSSEITIENTSHDNLFEKIDLASIAIITKEGVDISTISTQVKVNGAWTALEKDSSYSTRQEASIHLFLNTFPLTKLGASLSSFLGDFSLILSPDEEINPDQLSEKILNDNLYDTTVCTYNYEMAAGYWFFGNSITGVKMTVTYNLHGNPRPEFFIKTSMGQHCSFCGHQDHGLEIFSNRSHNVIGPVKNVGY